MAYIREDLFSTDQYNKPRTLKGKDALAVIILRLIKAKPGTDRLHPERGGDIIRRYLFCGPDDLDELDEELQKQINVYLPKYNTCKVTSDVLTVNGKSNLKLRIEIDDTIFSFSTDKDSLSDTDIYVEAE